MQLIKERRGLYILVAFATIFKLIGLYWVSNFNVWEENSMVLNFLQNGQMVYFHDGCPKYNFGDPVYPYILAFVYKLFGVNYAFGAALNVILSALSALMFYDV